MGAAKSILLATFAFFSAVVVACAAGPRNADPTDQPSATSVHLETDIQPVGTPTFTPSASTSSPVCFSPTELTPFAFAPDGNRLLVRTRDAVQGFDLTTGELVSERTAEGEVVTAAISPDGSLLAWSLFDNSIQLIRMDSGDLVATIRGHADPVLDLHFSADGEGLYSASHDGWVRAWASDGSALPSIQPGGEVLGFGLSADGRWLATVPADGPVLLWDLVDHSVSAELGGSGGYDTSDVTFSADGQYIASDLATGIYVWRLADHQLAWQEVTNSMAVTFAPVEAILAFSDVDQGNQVVLASADGQRVLRTFEGPRGPVWALFFSADGSLLAASDGVTIEIWRIGDGALVAVGKADCP